MAQRAEDATSKNLDDWFYARYEALKRGPSDAMQLFSTKLSMNFNAMEFMIQFLEAGGVIHITRSVLDYCGAYMRVHVPMRNTDYMEAIRDFEVLDDLSYNIEGLFKIAIDKMHKHMKRNKGRGDRVFECNFKLEDQNMSIQFNDEDTTITVCYFYER